MRVGQKRRLTRVDSTHMKFFLIDFVTKKLLIYHKKLFKVSILKKKNLTRVDSSKKFSNSSPLHNSSWTRVYSSRIIK